MLFVDAALRSVAQVCSVLESLEQEYKREEDWCGGADKLGPNSESDHVTPMISKHLEQKEAFLKVTQSVLFRPRGRKHSQCNIYLRGDVVSFVAFHETFD